MVRLEKDKVYKIISSHPSVETCYTKNYIIVCPYENFFIDENKNNNFKARFIVCYDGNIVINSTASIQLEWDKYKVICSKHKLLNEIRVK